MLPTGSSAGGFARDWKKVSEEQYLRVLFGKSVGFIPVKMGNIRALKAIRRKFQKQIFPGLVGGIGTYLLLLVVLFSKHTSFNYIVAFNQFYFNNTNCLKKT